MKTLYLVRHAKSSWDHPGIPDRDRPLEERGERDAAKMGQRWSHRHVKPQLILSSPAVRALATAKVIAGSLDTKLKHIVVDDRLYDASADALIGVIEGLDERLERVMLIGHNPGLADLAHHFSSTISQMPTCALAEFIFDVKTWSGIGHACPSEVALDSPKQSSA